MTKQLFQLVSLGSSNTAVTCRFSREMMKKATLVLFALIVASLMIGAVYATPTVDVQPPIVQPGDTVTITGVSSIDTIVTVSISNTRAVLTSFNITSDLNGDFSSEYVISDDSPVDVYLVTITSDNETAEVSFIVSKMSQEQLVNTIRIMVVNAKNQAESAIIQARKQGQTVSTEAIEKYRQGLQNLEDAVEAIENQNFEVAQQSLREALNRFNEVVEDSYGDNVEPTIDPVEANVRVQEQIDQLWRQYNQINTTLLKLRAYGVDVDVLILDSNLIRNRIQEAENFLVEDNIAEAETSITETKRLVTQKIEALRTRQSEVTKRLAERYQTSLENRVQTYIDTFQQLQSVRPVQSALALQELERLETRLVESETLLEEGNVITAIREMQSTETRIKRLSASVNGAVTSRYLSRIDELTAKLQTSMNSPEIQGEIDDIKEALTNYLHQKRAPSGSGVSSAP